MAKKVLLIDERREVSASRADLLRDSGYDVKPCNSIRDARETVAKRGLII